MTITRAGSKELHSKDSTDTEQNKCLILTIHTYQDLSKTIQRVSREFDIKTALNPARYKITPY